MRLSNAYADKIVSGLSNPCAGASMASLEHSLMNSPQSVSRLLNSIEYRLRVSFGYQAPLSLPSRNGNSAAIPLTNGMSMRHLV
jgi:hypothetical protein